MSAAVRRSTTSRVASACSSLQSQDTTSVFHRLQPTVTTRKCMSKERMLTVGKAHGVPALHLGSIRMSVSSKYRGQATDAVTSMASKLLSYDLSYTARQFYGRDPGVRCLSTSCSRPYKATSSSSNPILHERVKDGKKEGSRQKLRMIILGAPGAGKGTQGDRLLKKYNIATVGVGDLLRSEIQKGSQLGREAELVMKQGGLMSDDIILKLVEPEIDKLRDTDWLLDGFPRKASQAVLLDQVLSKYNDELNLVVSLAVPDEVILERIEGRWIHPGSGRMYNATFNPPKVKGIDDISGEPLTKRPDDTVEIFEKRLKSFHAENGPLLGHYRREAHQGTASKEDAGKLVTLQGRTSDEIWPKLEDVVKERFPDLELR